jgi:hypothetical protein
MSHSAQDLIELMRLARCGGGALTQHLLREVAMSILSTGAGLASERVGAVMGTPVNC